METQLEQIMEAEMKAVLIQGFKGILVNIVVPDSWPLLLLLSSFLRSTSSIPSPQYKAPPQPRILHIPIVV